MSLIVNVLALSFMLRQQAWFFCVWFASSLSTPLCLVHLAQGVYKSKTDVT